MNEENELIRDPDYELTESVKHQKKIREDLEKKQMIQKTKGIIRREFQKELEIREQQLELIQQRLIKAAKSLHLLRYCLVTGYYNKNEFHVSSGNEDVNFVDKQSRIHPAVKQLLGNNSQNVYLGLRKKKQRESLKESDLKDSDLKELTLKESILKESPLKQSILKESTLKESILKESGLKRTISEIETTPEIKLEKSNDLEIKTEPKDVTETQNINLIRNRKMYKHQIVIGNISKWAPSESPEDSSTHKWMVYIRGPKEFPDISHIIQKVVFYLHPSYKPNDVIEVTKSPFHLSRRGWGEFPLRVQLFFHGELNKPVDVIHNLKLDRTRSGRQTLGNETIIELSLYDMNKSDVIRKRNGYCDKTDQNEENNFQITNEFIIKEEVIEHDEQKRVENLPEFDLIAYIDYEHNYCRKDEESQTESSDTSPEKSNGKTNGELIGIRNKRKVPFSTLLSTTLNKRIKNEFFEDSRSENFDMERYEINLDSYKLKNLHQMLIILFKKLPLVSEVARCGNYKWMYPFTASSENEFNSWNVAKQFSSEWARAQLIRKFLQTSSYKFTLTTKDILEFGRAHGFTHPISYDVYSSLNHKIFDYSQFKTDHEWENLPEQDTHVDVISNNGNKPKREDGILIKWTDNYKHERSFVKQAALDVGVLLKQEQIVPGVLYSTSERIIYECVKSFAEDLIRRSFCWAVTNEKFNSDCILTPSHIIKGLHHREEYKKILAFNEDTLRY